MPPRACMTIDNGMSTELGRERARRNVRVLMVEKFRTQAKMAKASGVDAGTLSDFLSGKRWPHPETLDRLEHALDLTADTIQGWADGREPESSQDVPDHASLAGASELDLVLELLARIRGRDFH